MMLGKRSIPFGIVHVQGILLLNFQGVELKQQLEYAPENERMVHLKLTNN